MYQFYEFVPLITVTHLVNASYYQLPSDYEEAGERHNFWELVYVDRGEIIVQAENTRYLLKSGEAAFHCPNEYHNVLIHDGNPASIIVIAFVSTSPAISAFFNRIIQLEQYEKQCLTTIVREADSAFAYFENEAPYFSLIRKEDAPPGADQIISTCLEQLLIYLYRRENSIHVQTRMLNTGAVSHHEALAERARNYIDLHIAEKITIDSLAAALNISPSHLKHVFKNETGLSVISYVTQKRISEAKHLIRRNEMTFSQIAERVGFDNIYYFSNRFKKETGMTPSEYSRSLRT